MASVNDWAAKAAERIVFEFDNLGYKGIAKVRQEDRIAAIIATYAAPLLKVVNDARRHHDTICEAHYHKGARCSCGASKYNARIDRALNGGA